MTHYPLGGGGPLGGGRRRRIFSSRRSRNWPLIGLLAVLAAAVIVAATLLSSGTTAANKQSQTATVRPDPTSSPSTASSTTTAATTTTVPAPQPVWRVAWGSPMAWGYGVASNATVRDLATVALGGQAVKFRVSNLWGTQPLVIGAATLAQSAGGSATVPGSSHTVTFNGAPGVTIPPGQAVYTDPVQMAVTDNETLAISIWVQSTTVVSLHWCCTTSPIRGYFTANGRGNVTAAANLLGIGYQSTQTRFVDAVDVLETVGQPSIVVVGDSITDGYNSTLRWTHVLQQRIDSLPADEQRAVINEGITANALLPPTQTVPTDQTKSGGLAGLTRLASDALDQPGVGEVVLFLGTNDLWFGSSASELIAGYQQAIAEAHKAGIRIVGVTLLPRSTDKDEYWSPTDQENLVSVDNWIRTSGAFDGVLNMAPVMADVYNGQCDPAAMFPPYDSGDNLHPNPAGQTAFADAINPATLQLPSLPQVPPLVSVTATPGCDAASAP